MFKKTSSYLFSAHGAIGCCDAGSGGLLQCRDERVVLEVEPLQVLQGREAHGKLVQAVRVQVQVAKVSKLKKSDFEKKNKLSF
jgi:hypothetical protein